MTVLYVLFCTVSCERMLLIIVGTSTETLFSKHSHCIKGNISQKLGLRKFKCCCTN